MHAVADIDDKIEDILRVPQGDAVPGFVSLNIASLDVRTRTIFTAIYLRSSWKVLKYVRRTRSVRESLKQTVYN